MEYADIGGIAYENHGKPYPEVTHEKAQAADAILLGAVGGYQWEELEYSLRPERGLLAIRAELDLYANLRPAITFPELAGASSLKTELVSGLDIMIVRELTGSAMHITRWCIQNLKLHALCITLSRLLKSAINEFVLLIRQTYYRFQSFGEKWQLRLLQNIQMLSCRTCM